MLDLYLCDFRLDKYSENYFGNGKKRIANPFPDVANPFFSAAYPFFSAAI